MAARPARAASPPDRWRTVDVEALGREAHTRRHGADSGVEVVASDGQKMLQGVGVEVDGGRVALQDGREPVEIGARPGHPGATGQVLADGLVRLVVGFLGQIPNPKIPGGTLDLA